MTMTTLLSIARLRELLDYDPDTGLLTWKRRVGKFSSRWNQLYAGKIAGTVVPAGYVAVKILNRDYLAHRVVWAMVHGKWPECIKHRNGNLADNRLTNLADVSRAIVQRNLRMPSTNTSGICGVSWSKVPRRWVASIRVDDVTYNLGLFAHKEDAAKARRAAEAIRERRQSPSKLRRALRMLSLQTQHLAHSIRAEVPA